MTLSAVIGKNAEGTFDYIIHNTLLVAGKDAEMETALLHNVLQSVVADYDAPQLRILMADLEDGEFKRYTGIPHLLYPVITDSDWINALIGWLSEELRERIQNRLSLHPQKKPVILCILRGFDRAIAIHPELSFRLEELVQKGRDYGMHFVLTTREITPFSSSYTVQTVCPARIITRVDSQQESKLVLGQTMAENLAQGEMLLRDWRLGKEPVLLYRKEPETALETVKANAKGECELPARLWRIMAGLERPMENPLTEVVENTDIYKKAVELAQKGEKLTIAKLEIAFHLPFAITHEIFDSMKQNGILPS